MYMNNNDTPGYLDDNTPNDDKIYTDDNIVSAVNATKLSNEDIGMIHQAEEIVYDKSMDKVEGPHRKESMSDDQESNSNDSDLAYDTFAMNKRTSFRGIPDDNPNCLENVTQEHEDSHRL